jgi:hypothetical protein
MKHELDYNKIVNLLLDGKYIPDTMLLAFICSHFHEFLRNELIGVEPSGNKYFYSSMCIISHQFREMLTPEYQAVIDDLYELEFNGDGTNEQ